MKKFLRLFVLAISVICIVLTFTACNFVLGTGSSDTENISGLPGVTKPEAGTGGNSTTPSVFDDVSSYVEVTPNNVSLAVKADRSELTTEEAVKQVERSVVAIEMNGSSGAGVIVDITLEGGSENYIYIVTCHHVIESKGEIIVYIPSDTPTLAGDTNYTDLNFIFTGVIGGTISENANQAVTLVGGAQRADVAVIKIDMTKPAASGNVLNKSRIVKAKFASTEYQAERGETVFAIGNPTGLFPGWVSEGNISMLETSSSVEDIGDMLLMGIAVPTNPGNSGGGLFNLSGELIGITNAGNTSYDEINFSIPLYTSNAQILGAIDLGVVNVVKNIVGTESNVNYGFIPGLRALFGFTVAKLSGTDYPTISAVNSGSLAESYGLKVNDIIQKIQINGGSEITIDSYQEYIDNMNGLKLGDKFKLTIRRSVGAMGGYATYVTSDMEVFQYLFCNTGEFPE